MTVEEANRSLVEQETLLHPPVNDFPTPAERRFREFRLHSLQLHLAEAVREGVRPDWSLGPTARFHYDYAR